MTELGRARRAAVPRSAHGGFEPGDRDPVAILQGQNASRLQHLVPVRFGRMLQSPFAFYRGAAAVMATDLSTETVTGVRVVCCGDAHVANFGLYASPERRLLFDLNDFDEAGMAPWEWDVKRLASSVVVGGRDLGFSARQNRDAAEQAVRSYREGIRTAAAMSVPDRFYYSVDVDRLADLADKSAKRVLAKAGAKARSRTANRSLQQMTTSDEGGNPVIVDQPPLTQHVPNADLAEIAAQLEKTLDAVSSDAAQVLSQFRLVDFVLKVVGVGSVGTYCFVMLFLGPSGEPLFLQAKQASASVLQSHGGQSDLLPRQPTKGLRAHEGYRVVTCQRILQSQSDPFLVWVARPAEQATGRPKADFYLRQLRDMKGSIEVEGLSASQFGDYAGLCGALLARAHGQSPLCVAVASYLGNSGRFEEAVAGWAGLYADQNERDFERLASAAAAGEIKVEAGV